LLLFVFVVQGNDFVKEGLQLLAFLEFEEVFFSKALELLLVFLPDGSVKLIQCVLGGCLARRASLLSSQHEVFGQEMYNTHTLELVHQCLQRPNTIFVNIIWQVQLAEDLIERLPVVL
jgi:hypothetical protein